MFQRFSDNQKKPNSDWLISGTNDTSTKWTLVSLKQKKFEFEKLHGIKVIYWLIYKTKLQIKHRNLQTTVFLLISALGAYLISKFQDAAFIGGWCWK